MEGLYVMGHTSIPGYVFLVPHGESMTVAQMRAEAQAGLVLGAGSR